MKTLLLTLLAVPLFCPAQETEVISLFNGKDLSGWELDVPSNDEKDEPEATFVIREGLLVSRSEVLGHLISEESYSDYELTIEYRFVEKAGNSGVLVHVSKPRALYDMFPQSIEVQMRTGEAGDFWCIAEDITVPDMETRRERKEGQEFGGNEGDARGIKSLSSTVEKPVGEWNEMKIECENDEIKVTLNDVVVNHGTNCTTSKGKIAIQAEGSEVEFRTIQLVNFTK